MTDEAVHGQETDGGRWRVHVHDDDVHSYPGVAYVLHEVCGLPRERGLALADAVSRNGGAPVAVCDTAAEAEHAAAQIQLLGLRATVTGPE